MPCNYCNPQSTTPLTNTDILLNVITFDEDHNGFIKTSYRRNFTKTEDELSPITYCPMCGRRLRPQVI